MLSLFYFSCSVVLLVCCHTPERGLKCPGAGWRLLSGDWLGLSQREARLEPWSWLFLCRLSWAPEGTASHSPKPCSHSSTFIPATWLGRGCYHIDGSFQAHQLVDPIPMQNHLCLHPCSTTDFTHPYETLKNKAWIFSRLLKKQWFESGYYME